MESPSDDEQNDRCSTVSDDLDSDDDDDDLFYDPRDDVELYGFQPLPEEQERNAEVKATIERIVHAEPLLQSVSYVDQRLSWDMRTRLLRHVSTMIETRSGATLFAFDGVIYGRDHIFPHRRHSWSGDYVPAGEHRQLIKAARLQARFGDDAFATAMRQGARVPRETEDGRQQYDDYYLDGSVAQWQAECARK